VLRLARIAVAPDAQGEGNGRVLLRAVFTLAWRMSHDFGCVGVLVDAKPQAVGFYGRLGFRELSHEKGALGDCPAPVPMFLERAAVPRLQLA
jgi:GNAT superfamily N-acetyltransferase